jgi:hypothetical protein
VIQDERLPALGVTQLVEALEDERDQLADATRFDLLTYGCSSTRLVRTSYISSSFRTRFT